MSNLIKSVNEDSTVAIESVGNQPDFEWLSADEVGINGWAYPREKVLAALNAVPAEKARQMVEDERAHREFQAERDALAQTVERVRELREEARRTEARSGLGYISQVTEWFHKLDATLDPEPTFTLPTEVPARIEATPNWGPPMGRRPWFFTLWSDGNTLSWKTADGGSSALHHSPESIMSNFTGHRLIGGEE